MSATEKPVTELTPKTSTSALSGNAVVIYNKTTGDADSLDGDSLKTLLDDADTAYQLPQTGIPRTDLSQDIKDELDSKASRDTDAVEGDLAEFDANGNPVDSGIATSSVMLKDVSAGEGDLAVFNDEGGVTPGFNVDEVMRKTVGTVEGNLAEFNADGNPVDSGVPTSKIGEIEEKVTVLRNSAGVAEGIADTLSAGTAQEFVFRQSGGDGVNYMKRIKGKTLAWNQLVDAWDTTGSSELYGVTYTGTDEGIVVNGTATAQDIEHQSSVYVAKNLQLPLGHKILVFLNKKQYQFRLSDERTDSLFGDNGVGIFTNNLTGLAHIHISLNAGATANNELVKCNVIDLTILYGNEIAGMTDAQILAKYEAEYGTNLYPYNPGTLISNDASEIETVGFNQWDEEWEVGTISGGAPYSDPDCIRSKNFIPVFPSTTYYSHVGSAQHGATLGVSFYDSGFNYLSYQYYCNTTFTTPSNAYYIKIWTQSNPVAKYGNVYLHDICINLSDASFNGQYEPYWKRRIELGLNNIKVKSHNIWDEEWELGYYDTSNGQAVSNYTHVRSKNYIPCNGSQNYYIKYTPVGSETPTLLFYDNNHAYISYLDINGAFTTPANAAYIQFYLGTPYGATYNHDICINVSSSFNGQYEPHGILTINGLKSAGSVYDEIVGNKYVKRVGRVDLGTLTWLGPIGVFYANAAAIGKKASSNNLLCDKYATITPTSSDAINGICQRPGSGNESYINIIDSAYTDLTSFRAAMVGVMLNYELATPIEYELVDHLPFAILVDKFGTEQAIYPTHEDGSPSAPFACDSNYSISVKNLVAIINSLNTE